MPCIKCGVESQSEQVFCDSCLEGMQRHPVKPDTPVVLPPKAYAPTPKRATHHHRPRRTEESSARLRLRLRVVTALCVLLTLALVLSLGYIFHSRSQQPAPQPPDPGQNYSTGPIHSASTSPTN